MDEIDALVIIVSASIESGDATDSWSLVEQILMDLGRDNHLPINFFSTECKCNLQGSKNNNCRPDSGKCECKDGYSGIHCELSIGENIYCLLILEWKGKRQQLLRLLKLQWMLAENSTGPVQGQNRVFPVQYFHTGKNLFSLQGTPVLIAGTLYSLQGIPCENYYTGISL